MSFNDKHYANAVLARSERKAAEINLDVRNCVKCGHQERQSDNEGGTCEARIVLEQAELGVETTECGCFCRFPTELSVCAQCESNARFNEAGGYTDLAQECREYCRRGHTGLPAPTALEPDFARAWAEAPQSYKRLVEMEIAEFFYLLGAREAVRVAQESIK